MSWTALKQGVKFTLPDSGLEVWLRPVDFTIYAAYAGLADELMTIVLKSLESASGDGKLIADVPLISSVSDGLIQSRQLMEGYAKCAFVTPRAVDNPVGENEIDPKWLSWADLNYVYTTFNLSLPQLIRFSEEQAAGLQPVLNQPIDSHTT